LGKSALAHPDPASALAFALLIVALLTVILFEASNGSHDSLFTSS
jgi:hypothetical protein